MEVLDLELEMVAETASPGMRLQAGAVLASLPFGWLVEVWARGLDVVCNRFCLAAKTTDGVAWTLLCVGPELGEPAALTLAPVDR